MNKKPCHAIQPDALSLQRGSKLMIPEGLKLHAMGASISSTKLGSRNTTSMAIHSTHSRSGWNMKLQSPAQGGKFHCA